VVQSNIEKELGKERMMLFLIEYERSNGKLITFRAFDDAERETAENTRLDMELGLNRRDVGHEIVLLEAENEEALRRTHRRYFENLFELATPPSVVD
jgi:hypothetical protein